MNADRSYPDGFEEPCRERHIPEQEQPQPAYCKRCNDTNVDPEYVDMSCCDHRSPVSVDVAPAGTGHAQPTAIELLDKFAKPEDFQPGETDTGYRFVDYVGECDEPWEIVKLLRARLEADAAQLAQLREQLATARNITRRSITQKEQP